MKVSVNSNRSININANGQLQSKSYQKTKSSRNPLSTGGWEIESGDYIPEEQHGKSETLNLSARREKIIFSCILLFCTSSVIVFSRMISEIII